MYTCIGVGFWKPALVISPSMSANGGNREGVCVIAVSVCTAAATHDSC